MRLAVLGKPPPAALNQAQVFGIEPLTPCISRYALSISGSYLTHALTERPDDNVIALDARALELEFAIVQRHVSRPLIGHVNEHGAVNEFHDYSDGCVIDRGVDAVTRPMKTARVHV